MKILKKFWLPTKKMRVPQNQLSRGPYMTNNPSRILSRTNNLSRILTGTSHKSRREVGIEGGEKRPQNRNSRRKEILFFGSKAGSKCRIN